MDRDPSARGSKTRYVLAIVGKIGALANAIIQSYYFVMQPGAATLVAAGTAFAIVWLAVNYESYASFLGVLYPALLVWLMSH